MATPAPPPTPRAPGTGQSAVSLLDEAVHRLRLAPPGTLTIYYSGTLPFILALLYFWADQSHSADADTRGPGAALGLALLFVLMKICQAVFAARVAASIRHRAARRGPGRGWRGWPSCKPRSSRRVSSR